MRLVVRFLFETDGRTDDCRVAKRYYITYTRYSILAKDVYYEFHEDVAVRHVWLVRDMMAKPSNKKTKDDQVRSNCDFPTSRWNVLVSGYSGVSILHKSTIKKTNRHNAIHRLRAVV